MTPIETRIIRELWQSDAYRVLERAMADRIEALRSRLETIERDELEKLQGRIEEARFWATWVPQMANPANEEKET